MTHRQPGPKQNRQRVNPQATRIGLSLVGGLVAVGLLLGPFPTQASAAGDGRGGIGTNQIGKFDAPVYVVGPKGAGGLVFVVEQPGRIKMIKGNRKVGGTFLDLTDRVQDGGERGLLSVAFDPRYRKTRKFFVFYTDSQGDLVVEQYKRSPSRSRKALKGSAKRLLDIPHRDYSNHNGGQLQFGPNRLLYVSTGDGGSSGDPDENAQNKEVLLGKLLRIDPFRSDGNRNYSIPDGNPFNGSSGADEIFSIGLRNPFRFSFDRKKPNRLFIGDVGQDRFEEINYDLIGMANGANYGWDAFEGYSQFSPDASPIPANHDEPVKVTRHTDGNCSVIGGYVVRDKRLRSLRGRYVYTDLCNGKLRSFIPRLSRARNDRSSGIDLGSGTASFGEDRFGRIYIANVLNGEVVRLSPKR